MLDRQYTPTINVWPVPDNVVDTIRYYGVYQLEDITKSYEDADVPYRWTDAICAGLASKLAVKFAPDKFPLLNGLYNEAFSFASANDNDGVSLKLQPTGLNLR